jgi:hypothetical protein
MPEWERLIVDSWKIVTYAQLSAAATTITLTNLDLAGDKWWKLMIAYKNVAAATTSIALYYNNDQTATNYYRQYLSVSGAAVASGRVNDALIFGAVTNTSQFGHLEITRDVDGYPRAMLYTNRAAPASIDMLNQIHIRNNTANVTRIDLVADQANAFGIGSKILLLKYDRGI